MIEKTREDASFPIVFIDDAHTFGGAQVALAWAVRVILQRTTEKIVCVCTARTRLAIMEIVGEDQRLEFIEGPSALPFNGISFPLRVIPFLFIIFRLRRKGVRAWWLNLSGIEFCLAPLCVLKLLGETPHAWLHNPQKASFFFKHGSWSRRSLSWFRDALADRWLFRLHRCILTPSRSTLSELQSRLHRFPQPLCLGYLYHPTFLARRARIPAPNGPDGSQLGGIINLWMIGRIEYGTKNNLLALDVMKCLFERGRAVNLTVVGDGPDAEHFRSKIKNLGAGEVNFLGWKSDPWLAVPKNAVVPIPSFYETMCIVAREAMIRGIRIVCSPIPVFHEWIPSRLIADSLTGSAFAEKIVEVRNIGQKELEDLYATALAKFSDAIFTEEFLSYTNHAERTRP